MGVGEDTPLSPHDEERDEEEGNGRWGLEEWEREALFVKIFNVFLIFN